MTQNTRQDVQTIFKDVISKLQESPSTTPYTFTVCQHIYFKKIIPILKRIGIKILYTPHAQLNTPTIDGIIIRGLPLYPVNGTSPSEKKDLLYSFVGAYNPNVYMSDIRKRIYDMKHPEHTVIYNTKQWHFEKHVYHEQMRGIQMTEEDINKLKHNKDVFQSELARSRYSLCPSGSGPNSIRLWESMQCGAIPVILSDTLRMPRHDTISWEYAIITVPEADLEYIPQILNDISPEVEEKLRSNCIELFNMICGPNGDKLDEVIRMEFRSYEDNIYTNEYTKIKTNLLEIDDLETRNMKIFTSHKNSIDKCPQGLRNNIEQWRKLNNSYRFKYFTDEEMDDWMIRHSDKRTYNNYQSLNSGAGKADLFRICKLYYEGGIWVDADLPAFDINQHKPNFRQLIHSNNSVLIRNRKCDNPRYTIIASKSGSDLMYHQIQYINNNIERATKTNKYQVTIHITGPFVLHKLLCITQKLEKIEQLPLNTMLKVGNSSFIYIDDIVPERETYELENTYEGYIKDLSVMGVKPHSTIRSIK
jgi:Exostosin family/Capsular polysaccharide synthesis protein